MTLAAVGTLRISRCCTAVSCHQTDLEQGRCLAKAHPTHEHREEDSEDTATCKVGHRPSTPIRQWHAAVNETQP